MNSILHLVTNCVTLIADTADGRWKGKQDGENRGEEDQSSSFVHEYILGEPAFSRGEVPRAVGGAMLELRRKEEDLQREYHRHGSQF